jgi:hypothetical protein
LPIIAATAVAGGLIVATLWWRDQRRARDDQRDAVVIVAERGTAAIEGRADASTPDPLDAAVAAAPVDAGARPVDAGRGGGGSRPRQPPPNDPLSQAFDRHRALVEKCYDDHPAPGNKRPSVTLRFEIGVDGVPTKVEALPVEIGKTPLGACIAGVGRGTRFPTQDAPTAFRFLVSVRTSGGAP